MPTSAEFVEFVLAQLSALPELRAKRMFGGYGLYADGRFFGILHENELYFKTDATTRKAYLERGMPPFRPSPKQTLKTYFLVPPEVLEMPAELSVWAAAAVAVAGN